jgi:hypothetical protein
MTDDPERDESDRQLGRRIRVHDIQLLVSPSPGDGDLRLCLRHPSPSIDQTDMDAMAAR